MYNGQMETDPTTQPEEKECLMRIGPRKYTEHTLSDHLHPPATEQARAQVCRQAAQVQILALSCANGTTLSK